MNIENYLRNADVYLEMSREKFDRQDYKGALASLCKAYDNVCSIIEQVYKLNVESSQTKCSAGEDT